MTQKYRVELNVGGAAPVVVPQYALQDQVVSALNLFPDAVVVVQRVKDDEST